MEPNYKPPGQTRSPMEQNNLQAPQGKPGNLWNKIIYKPPGQISSPMEPNNLQTPRANQVTYGTK